MTVAAAIETGIGKPPTQGLENQSKAVFGAGRSGLAAQGTSLPSMKGSGSFRAGWQSLLASIGTSLEDLDLGKNATGQQATSSEAKLTETTGRLTASAGVENKSEDTNAEARLSSALGAGSVSTISREETPANKVSKENKPAANVVRENLRKSSSPHPGKITSLKLVAAEVAVDLASAAVESTSQIAPTVAAASPDIPSTGLTSKSAPTALRDRIALSHKGSETDPFLSRQSQSTEVSIQVSVFTPVIVRQTAEAPEPFSNQREQSSVLNSGDPTIPAQIASDSTKSQGNSQSPMPSFPDAGNSLDSSALSRIPLPGQMQVNQSQSAATAQDALPQPTSGQASVRRSAPNPSPGQTVAAIHNSNPAIAAGQNAVEITSTSQTSPKNFVTGQNEASTLHQGGEQVAAQPATQGPGAYATSISRAELSSSPEIASVVAALPVQFSPASPQAPDKQGVSGSGKGSAVGLTRSVRAAGTSESVQRGTLLEEGQLSPLAADASTISRVVENQGSAPTSASITISTEPDSREAFATLDAGAAGKPAWLHADARRAEAGFQDPALGWVSVRADLNGGGVHAELVSGSTEAAQALGSQLAGLNAYLSEHHTAVETLTVTSPESGGPGLGSGQGTGAETQQGPGQQSGQQTPQDSGASIVAGATSLRSLPIRPTSESPIAISGMDGSMENSWQGGTHISVMA